MSLFSFLSQQVEVRENHRVITVTGVKHAGNMIKRLDKVFNTSRVPTYMFNTFSSNKFSFYSYFAIDVIYALRKLITAKDKYLYVPEKTILAIIEKIEQDTWVKDTLKEYPSKLNYKRLNDFNIAPLPHQREFFDLYDKVTQKFKLNSFLAFFSPGLGKTLLSLMLTKMLEVDQTIIVCPKATVYNVWVDNILKFMKRPDTYWYSTATFPMKGNEKYIIIHYEYLQKLLEQLKRLKGKKFAVVLDESHNFNEITSNRSNLFVQMCKQLNIKEGIWLSGTAFKAVAMEAIPLIKSVDPLFTDEVEERFKKVYAGTNVETNQMLNSRLQLYMKIVKKEVINLEKPIEETIKIKIPNGDQYTLPAIKEQMKVYIAERLKYYESRKKADYDLYFKCLDMYEKTLRVEDRTKFRDYNSAVSAIRKVTGNYFNVIEQMKLANQYEKLKIIPSLPKELKKPFEEAKTIVKYVDLKINGEVLGVVVGRARINCHVDMVPFIPLEEIVDRTDKKTLVFTSFVDVVKALENNAKEIGLNPLTAYADNSKDLTNIISRFANDNYDPLITTYATLSTGVPLIMADKVILVNAVFRNYLLSQAISRVHRLGQTNQVYIYKCELDTGDIPNISTRSRDIMEWARESVKQITGVDYVETETEADPTLTVGLEDFYSNELR